MSGARDERDARAGEYVLGLLDAAEAAALLRAAETDPALAAAIDFWQARLDPLADSLPEVPPTSLLWARIRTDMPDRAPVVAAPPPAAAPEARFWRPLAVGGLLLAACLAGLLLWSGLLRQQAVRAYPAVALLTAPGSLSPSARLQVFASGEAVLVPLAKLPVPEGRQMDLWAWPREAPAPVLLGRVGQDGGTLPFRFPARDGTPVMITSEPQGGAPPGAPGPTLYAGLLAAWH
jgi:anti-sigma-K factor RskA